MARLYTNELKLKEKPLTDRAEEKDAFALKATNPAWRPICPYLPCQRASRLMFKRQEGSFYCLVCKTAISSIGSIFNCPDRSKNG